MSTTTLPPGREDATRARRRGGGLSDRARAERRLGWMLAGPAFVVMLLVTAYPILQAVYDSLFDYRLTDPDNRSFIGLSNYWVDPHRPAVVAGDRRHRVHHGRHGRRRAGPRLRARAGDGKALKSLRPVLRAAILIPYAIITVVSAFAWQFAFDINTGFVNTLVRLAARHRRGHRLVRRPVARRCFVICLAEIWKTTPFISLLLLAGLAQVPDVLQEAAKVDGATWWQRLWQGDDPEHEGRDHGRPAVPHPRRVPRSSTASSS